MGLEQSCGRSETSQTFRRSGGKAASCLQVQFVGLISSRRQMIGSRRLKTKLVIESPRSTLVQSPKSKVCPATGVWDIGPVFELSCFFDFGLWTLDFGLTCRSASVVSGSGSKPYSARTPKTNSATRSRSSFVAERIVRWERSFGSIVGHYSLPIITHRRTDFPFSISYFAFFIGRENLVLHSPLHYSVLSTQYSELITYSLTLPKSSCKRTISSSPR